MKLHGLVWITFLFSFNALAFNTVHVVTEEFPPHQMIVDGQIKGIATEKIRKAFALAEIEADIQLMPWARAFETTKKVPNTFIYSMNRTTERESLFQWIGVVSDLKYTFISLARRNLTLNSIDDAKNYITSIIRNASTQDYLVKHGFTINRNLFQVASHEEHLNLLLQGKIDFIYTDIETIKFTLENKNLPIETVKVSSETLVVYRDLYLATNKDSDPILIKKITDALQSINSGVNEK